MKRLCWRMRIHGRSQASQSPVRRQSKTLNLLAVQIQNPNVILKSSLHVSVHL